SLPFEPEVVSMGDMGNMGLLDDSKFLITQEFNKIVDEIIKFTTMETKTIPEPKKKIPIRKKRSEDLKVLVVPVSDGKLSSHFGHCKQFAFIEIQHGKIAKTEMLTPPTHEPGVLPRWLNEQGADIVIAAGMGEKAQQLLEENGIEVIIGAPMDSPESLTNQYLSGTLVTGANVCDH
ncbi:MAG: NifB/NifX family molybdenum-iron cluster-binding protein, partial [Desulfobacterales bacterium]